MNCAVCGALEGTGDCRECRALAAEIGANTEALSAMREEPIPALVERPADFVPMRADRTGRAESPAAAWEGCPTWFRDDRDRSLVFRRRIGRQRAVWWMAAAAALLLSIGLPVLRNTRGAQKAAAVQASRGGSPSLKVKLLTPDPSVVIYWLVDSKESDAR